MDLAIAVPLLCSIAPLLAALSLSVRAGKGAPFFSPDAPRSKGSPFRLFKFRTMRDDRDENGQLLPDEQRLTALGAWMRMNSLDELPQLWNVSLAT